MIQVLLAVTSLGVLTAGAASAAPSNSAQRCIALGRGSIHIAATVARPQDCCTGQMQCAQFLSTVTVVRPGIDQHT